MASANTQDRVEALRQRISAGRSRADDLFTAIRQTPAKEQVKEPTKETERVVATGRAFSFVASIHNDDMLKEVTKAKLKAVMDSLHEKSHAPEHGISMGQVIPPAALPGMPRSKETLLT
ncbi:MAG: hypothetical protein K2Q01_12550 [Rickettsiales bacterium]|nr:hypothetical protein [Rickettsiales bacterium]